MSEERHGGSRGGRIGRGKLLSHTGGFVSLLVTGEDTLGHLAIIETTERKGCDHPYQVHTRADQIVYVLEGELVFYLDDERLRCGRGACVLLPRGCEHTVTVESEEARLLIILVPAGLEGFYMEIAQIAEADGRLDGERLVTVAARFGVQITGPGPAHEERTCPLPDRGSTEDFDEGNRMLIPGRR